jgi:hypothetical protein
VVVVFGVERDGAGSRAEAQRADYTVSGRSVARTGAGNSLAP